jgi:hypothetical protein
LRSSIWLGFIVWMDVVLSLSGSCG